jgi:outer membrane protein OmpA-like peptidoglycan-associated protein
MKQIKLAVIALFALAITGNANAQDADNPWVIGFGINTVDVRTYSEDFGTNLEDLVGTEEWEGNTIPSISRISVEKYLNKGFTLQLAGTLNKISTIIEKDDADALYYSIDALVKYDLNHLVGQTGWFDPYLGLGGSYQELDSEVSGFDGRKDGMLNGAIGFNTWFNQNIGLNFQTTYKHHFTSTGYDVFQHSIGLVIKFGGKDTDGDGIYDDKDSCPEVAGLVEFNGCPDADGDGIKDADDACPNVAGLAAMNGCPDADGDGVADKDDMCPNTKGTKANKGCPDTDGDSVLDKDDKCVTVAGPVANGGCPWPDTDGDGVLDKDDKCVTVVGPASNNGCPEPVITEQVKAEIGNFAKTILFNTGKASFKAGITSKLDAIAGLMTKFDRANFIIEGHTDSSGKASSNLRLSDTRANAVMQYLVSKGISTSRLSAKGFGEDYPVDSNKTRAGRTNNRRVEIKVTN